MRRLLLCLTALAALATIAIAGSGHPPQARREPVQDTYFGVTVTDPYRWMEKSPNPELATWMKAQNEYTREVLDRIPGRDRLAHRIAQLNSTATSVMNVQRDGSRVFYLKTRPGDSNYRLYVRESLQGPERVLVDPMRISTATSHYSIDYYDPSWDGEWVAYGISPGGSEDSVIHIVNVGTGREQPERIDRAENGGIAWRSNNHSFYYNRLQKMQPGMDPTEKYRRSQVYLHQLGYPPDSDRPIVVSGLENPIPLDYTVPMSVDDMPTINLVANSRWAFLQISHGVQNEITLYAAPEQTLWPKFPDGMVPPIEIYAPAIPRMPKGLEQSIPWTKVCDVEDAVTHFDVQGDDIYLLTHKRASRYEIVRRRLTDDPWPPNEIPPPVVLGQEKVVVPASTRVIVSCGVAADALYIQDLDGGLGRLRRIPWGQSTATDVPLPWPGAIADFDTDVRYPGTLVRLTAWTHCPLWYRYDPTTRRMSDTHLRPIDPVDFSRVESTEVRATSADGTSVPLSILRLKGTRLDGTHPTLLEGYGSYGVTMDPSFDPTRLAWLEEGGIWAMSHVRGGGEFGEDWHVAGMKLTKQHTIDDFLACARYLVDHQYCTSRRLAGSGTSAGGITIGGALTQRPDLFGAALIRVGAVNSLRDEFTPNGPPNIPEFGTVTTEEGFKGLYAMDAYAHVKDRTSYPGIMVTTGIHDPRVAFWEPAKMAARLQAATSSHHPILLRVDYDAGHGMGSTIPQRNRQRGDEWAFLLWQLGQPGFQPH